MICISLLGCLPCIHMLQFKHENQLLCFYKLFGFLDIKFQFMVQYLFLKIESVILKILPHDIVLSGVVRLVNHTIPKKYWIMVMTTIYVLCILYRKK